MKYSPNNMPQRLKGELLIYHAEGRIVFKLFDNADAHIEKMGTKRILEIYNFKPIPSLANGCGYEIDCRSIDVVYTADDGLGNSRSV